jgi:hypothetical protein
LWWLKLVVICGLLLGITIVLLYGMRSGLFWVRVTYFSCSS